MKLIWVQLALGLFQTDLAVKHEVETNPEFGKKRTFCGDRVRVFRFHNDGTAGSKFRGHMPAIIRISGILTLGCIGKLLSLLGKEGHTAQKLGFSLMTGGALSNLFDRCKKGYVVDYISFRTPWKRLTNLVFNLSDFFIFLGAIFICLGQTDRTQR